MTAVESRSGMRGDIDGADLLAGLVIERVELVARRKPDVLAVVSDAGDVVDAGKGTVFAEDFARDFFMAAALFKHDLIGMPGTTFPDHALAARQRARE